MLFQIFSRNNDPSGNPYRLILIYTDTGNIVSANEARSSTPNFVIGLRQLGYHELPSFHLTPLEYRRTQQAFMALRQVD